MKIRKVYESYGHYDEIDDYMVSLIEDGYLEREPRSQYGESSGLEFYINRFEPSSFISTYKMKLKSVISSTDDLDFNISLLSKLKSPILRSKLKFDILIKENIFTFYIPFSPNIQKFRDSLRKSTNIGYGIEFGGIMFEIKDWVACKDFSIEIQFSGRSWEEVKKINDSPNTMIQLKSFLEKNFNISNWKKTYRARLESYGEDWMYSFTIK